MKEVEFYRWWLPADGMWKRRLTSWTMDEQYALKTYPGCEKEPSSRTVRLIAETKEEQDAFNTSLHTNIKPENAGRRE